MLGLESRRICLAVAFVNTNQYRLVIATNQ